MYVISPEITVCRPYLLQADCASRIMFRLIYGRNIFDCGVKVQWNNITWKKLSCQWHEYPAVCGTLILDSKRISRISKYLYLKYRATSSGAKVRTVVTLVPAEQGRYRLKRCHFNFDPYPSRTQAEPWVTLVATANNAHVLILRWWKWFKMVCTS